METKGATPFITKVLQDIIDKKIIGGLQNPSSALQIKLKRKVIAAKQKVK